ncbi:MAG: hypothetical protein JXA52_03945, partial [Planctomycetes bacterium]|nr:hypothetical protein [Planctomycetota bacterium]
MRSESRLLLILLLLLTISTAFAGEPAASKHGIPEIIAAFDKVEISRQEAEVCLLESFTAPEMGKPVLNAYLRWFMLTRKADELGVSVSPGEVQKKYNEFDAAPGGREAFEKDLRNSAQSWCRLEAVLKESLLLAKVARKLEDLPPETAIPQELIISIFDNLNRDYSPLINGLRRVPSAVVATVAG